MTLPTGAWPTVARLRGPAIWVLAAVFAVACGQTSPDPAAEKTSQAESLPVGAASDDSNTASSSTASSTTVLEIPQPDLTDMEPQVEKRLQQTRAAVEADPGSASAWGRFGMVAHAHELWDAAAVAYRRAEQLDPGDVRWPYYLGDVLSVLGTNLDEAAATFRRAMAQKADYGPAHMRLGRVLHAAGRSDEAAVELERALELEPGLQPARVTLAQIRLSEGKLEEAEAMLDRILAGQPRHAQALSTLGQIYMRQRRRPEARKIAERARDAAIYNLFSDPLMSQVIIEGVSSVLIWDRAKAFLDNGDNEQAALGLEKVLELQPDNADAHQQLAVAVGNFGELDRSRRHLERSVALAPDRVDSLIQLATVQIELQEPRAAVKHLQRVLELAPEDPDAGWMLGRALILSGDVRSGLASFDEEQKKSDTIPLWVRNDWGSALAQNGRPNAALEQFRAVLAQEPENAQALFYVGLVLEGLGRVAEAVEHYCRSMKAQPNPPAGSRLQALGQVCR